MNQEKDVNGEVSQCGQTIEQSFLKMGSQPMPFT